jgi:thioredoxin reductase
MLQLCIFKPIPMETPFDAIILGGSYSGLSAALALGRARRNVLVIDANEPCNARVPHSHNLLTHDGVAPKVLREQAIADVSKYNTVRFHHGRAVEARGTSGAFVVRTADGSEHHGLRLLLAMGVRDELADITGLADCWGISAAACPFCHGYEVSEQPIAIIGNAPEAFPYALLIHNWSKKLTVFTNGAGQFTAEQRDKLSERGISIIEEAIDHVAQQQGQVSAVVLKDGSRVPAQAIFHHPKVSLHTGLIQAFGLQLTDQGLINVDAKQCTNVAGIFASGDCTTPMRALSMALATGSVAGSVIVHELVNA